MSASNKVHKFAAGEMIFGQGDLGDCMYFILSGSVAIRLNGVLLEELGEDQFFGEMALIDRQPRSADAVALTDCELEVVDERRFIFRVQEAPFFAIKVMRVMADRLRTANARS